MSLRSSLFLVAALLFAGMLYLFLSTPNYGDANVDPLTKGKEAFQQGDFDTAAEWFKVAAKGGKAQAQYRFAMLYRDGKGVEQDDSQAVRWLQLAAAQGHTRHSTSLASCSRMDVVLNNGIP